jgi:hypothetical protein
MCGPISERVSVPIRESSLISNLDNDFISLIFVSRSI